MALTEVSQFISTLGEIFAIIAPNAGGSIPAEDSEEYSQWRNAVTMKYEEASRRGFWRRLLTKDFITLREGDLSVTLPTRFQRANSLYIFAVGDVDWANPDRDTSNEETPQSLFAQMITDPEDEEFGLWQINFGRAITAEEAVDATIWYFATPPKPVASTDKVLLPGDMIAFGGMAEIFRISNLAGSQDSATQEYENRLATYLNMEMIPGRNEILKFNSPKPKQNYTQKARLQYTTRNRS